jgi:hypothetical protein
MNHSKTILVFVATALAGAIVAAPVAPTPEQSARIRRQVDALLKSRLQPEPLPLDPPNPFVPMVSPGVAPVAAAPVAPVATANPAPAPIVDRAAEDAALLARYASRLRITGLIRVKDQVHVIINDTPWKEGDFIIVSRDPGVVQLQVARIQPGQLTLKLEDAELVLRF